MSSSIQRHTGLRAIAAAAAFIVAIGASQLAHAQTPAPAPAPAPSPAPPPFKSPFPGSSSKSDEEAAFNNLVALYDQQLAARDAVKNAVSCGSLTDIENARDAYEAATKAFDAALNQYIVEYSGTVYPPDTTRDSVTHSPLYTPYHVDMARVELAVHDASKYEPKVASCPKVAMAIRKNVGHVRTTETPATSDTVTNQFDDSGDPVGFGIAVSDNMARSLLNHPVIVAPFVSLDFMSQTINHTFSATTFLGTTTHWSAMLGSKVGVVTRSGVFVYGLAGVSLLHQDLNLNFGSGLESTSASTVGVTLGAGAEFHPKGLHVKQLPLGLFVQYEHTAAQNATFNTPKASPTFNYAFARSDDALKVGVDVRLRK